MTSTGPAADEHILELPMAWIRSRFRRETPNADEADNPPLDYKLHLGALRVVNDMGIPELVVSLVIQGGDDYGVVSGLRCE